jgi:hypothetical protein
MENVTIDSTPELRWLISSDVAPLLQLAASWRVPAAAQLDQLRRACTSERARLVVEQAALRRRARTKFTHADEMFFTARALEQASDEIVAAYKSARMPPGGPLLDLCSGIGGDLLAMAARAMTTGIERDPAVAIFAAANLAAMQRRTSSLAGQTSSVLTRDATAVDLNGVAAWHVDPDRRPTGRRTTRVELHEPSAEVIEKMLAVNRNAAIKLAPGAVLPPHWQQEAELEWISRAGECRQLVAWFGELAQKCGERRATVLRETSTPVTTFVGVPQSEPPTPAKIGRYVYEPDAAVLAAGLAGTLATQLSVEPVAPAIAYWTSDELVDHAALSAFEVMEILSAGVKHLKPVLRARSIGTLEIKKRGIDIDPEKLRRELALRGDERATLLITRIAGRGVAILARRLR